MQFPQLTPEYKDYRQLTEPWDVVYGPFRSRRYGSSLGINILGQGQKICSFNCAYCELGKTSITMSTIKKSTSFLTSEKLDELTREGMRNITSQNIKIDVISVVGNGEPTLYPHFDVFSENIALARNEILPKVPLLVFSNCTQLHNRKIIKGLNVYDERIIKLDAGNDTQLKNINAPLVKDSIKKIIDSTKRLKDLTIQSMFIKGVINNMERSDLDDWIEAIALIKPKRVQVYTIERIPPISGIQKLSTDELYTIKALLNKKVSIPIDVID